MAKARLAPGVIGALLLAACGGTHGTQSAATSASVASSSASRVAPAIATVGELAPAWSGPALGGGTLSSTSFHGKPVYLNFFASWCEPCNDEASTIEALSKKYAASGVTVVGVDVEENAAKAGGFARAHGITYPIVVDSGSMRDAYGVNGLPQHVFIDRRGVVHDLVPGEMDAADIEAQLKAIATPLGA
jgi:thiol-disulfide isomerase/thioredoxin